MNASTQALHNRLDAVLALAASRLDKDRCTTLEAFAPEYFSRLDPEDMAERTPEDLLGALLSLLQLGEVRQPGRPKLRIFSPTPGEDGWWSRHSVIHVVNDDMPFLVDSTSWRSTARG
jgi:glutamate dehydrogenase